MCVCLCVCVFPFTDYKNHCQSKSTQWDVVNEGTLTEDSSVLEAPPGATVGDPWWCGFEQQSPRRSERCAVFCCDVECGGGFGSSKQRYTERWRSQLTWFGKDCLGFGKASLIWGNLSVLDKLG